MASAGAHGRTKSQFDALLCLHGPGKAAPTGQDIGTHQAFGQMLRQLASDTGADGRPGTVPTLSGQRPLGTEGIAFLPDFTSSLKDAYARDTAGT